MAMPAAVLNETIDVETPELVVLSYQVAGVGSRMAAALVDYLLVAVLLIVVNIMAVAFFGPNGRLIPTSGAAWALGALALVNLGAFWGYFVLTEVFWDGQTPGKKAYRLRVVRDGGLPITFAASATRNLVRFIDAQPGFSYGVGLASLFVSTTGKRLGDYAAGTIVVQEGLVSAPVVAEAPRPASDDIPLQHARLRDDEFALLDRFLARRDELAGDRAATFEAQFATRFADALADAPGATPRARLAWLRDAERTARARGLGARHDTGAARERHAITSRSAPRWAGFSAQVAEARKRGLAALGEQGVRAFVADYRDIAADLARLRTATRGAVADDVFYLNRLVASAHNLLYRRRELPVRAAGRFVALGLPATMRRHGRLIAVSALLLFGPALIAASSVVDDESVAAALVPPHMLDRAEDGVRRAAAGEGYIDDPQLFRPVMAGGIIANNVQVALAAFASGMLAGVPTILLLVNNGVSLGAVAGLYVVKGIGPLLLAFVAPHGVLELFAICVAGAAGLLLGGALLVPGARTRRQAFREDGVEAVTLFTAAALLLLGAGLLEGLVSPIEWWPLEGKLAVSGTTAALLYTWLRLGARPRPTTRRAP
ncbi:MAG: stage II sporulation protein M [Gemmatimonadaceae bacterium]|jgi:uncharacterized membrane protein SpoIIM required for sporulation/uncharacterized RDD family membrane protein YckC|nr:stage II sporulation protein M [Gemmatimonadaceae bacterium]